AKNPLGFDSAEVRKERSVGRHAALALALDHVGGGVDADVPAAVREEAVMQTLFASGPRRKGSRRIAATRAA
ncbi:MAG: hypothetical protein NTX87_11235, partial [Planctomycetota bacterium]|nr:hypothetical protein [Planctomycetota bacterium]